jgi:co-chaperonin GroES (HSP10)
MEKEKTIQEQRYENTLKLVEKYTIDPKFKKPDNFIIPFRKTVLIEKIGNDDVVTTVGGIIMTDTSKSDNVDMPNTGIVYGVGIDCSSYIREGQKVLFSEFSNLQIFLAGKYYYVVDEHNVYGCVPDKTYVRMDVKTDKEVDRTKRIKREEEYFDRKILVDENLKDKITEIKKKRK